MTRAETRERVARLRAFAEDADFLPILIHADPDPDAVAAALAVRALLRRPPTESPILCTAEMARPENRRMVELLRVRLTTVTPEELDLHERLVVVDTQPAVEGAGGRYAVIDHHPRKDGYATEFEDIRPHYGATATILTEYLRADDERRIHTPLATALLYGIRTDTATLSRGVDPGDVRAYAFLQARADSGLLRRIERPAHPPAAVRAFGRALATMEIEGDVAVAWAGRLDEEHGHILSDLADFCMAMEGIAWVGAAAEIDGSVNVSVRHLGDSPGAGDVARIMAGDDGSGGGHASMGRAILAPESFGNGAERGGGEAAALLQRVLHALERARAELD